MKTVYLVLGSLNAVGGVERVGLAYIEALKENGFEVILASLSRTDWNKVESIFGKLEYLPDDELLLRPSNINILNIYQNLLVNLIFQKSRKRDAITINLHADLVPIPSDIAHPQDPTFANTSDTTPILTRYHNNIPKAAYFAIHNRIHRKLIKNSLAKSKLLVSNSSFAKDQLEKWLGNQSLTIYPPVEVEKYHRPPDSDKRENIVVSCGRFAPEKKQTIIPDIASKLPEVTFYIIGSTPTQGLLGKISSRIIKQLEQKIKNLELDNVKILQNVSFEEQLSLYGKAKIFLHTAPVEHFGMAVVEGMASGLVPIVYKNGGPWNDIILKGKYGLGFSDIDEAAKAIKHVIPDETYHSMAHSAVERANTFSKESFKTNILSLVKRAC